MDKKLVKLTWTDAADPTPGDGTSWYSDEDVDAFSEGVMEVVSVGWLKSKTDKYHTLVADYINNDDGTTTWGRPTKVPNGMVTKIELLGIVPEDK